MYCKAPLACDGKTPVTHKCTFVMQLLKLHIVLLELEEEVTAIPCLQFQALEGKHTCNHYASCLQKH